ncbi:MAG: SPOR domain-containing protein [Mariprofundaceae bacterium]|nr:SPOR domain-containing protein [Mariprofundaceae bacterium]
MNEQKVALMTMLSCVIVVVGVLLFDEKKTEQNTQAILESEAVSELEFPSNLYQLPPVNKKDPTTSVSELALNKGVATIPPLKSAEKEVDDHNTVSSPLPKKETVKKPEKPKVKVHKPKKTHNKGYYVQIGAFKKLSGAKKKAAELTKANWRVKIVNRKGLRLLWVGPLSSRDRAKKAQTKLLKNRFTKGFIVKY